MNARAYTQYPTVKISHAPEPTLGPTGPWMACRQDAGPSHLARHHRPGGPGTLISAVISCYEFAWMCVNMTLIGGLPLLITNSIACTMQELLAIGKYMFALSSKVVRQALVGFGIFCASISASAGSSANGATVDQSNDDDSTDQLIIKLRDPSARETKVIIQSPFL